MRKSSGNRRCGNRQNHPRRHHRAKTSWTAPEILELHPLRLEKTALRNLISQVYRGEWKRLPDFAALKPDSVEEEHDGIICVEYLQNKGARGISIGWRPFDDKQFQWLTTNKDTNPKTCEPLPIGPVDGRPVIYRNFIEGSTSRSIGVGFPGGLNLAWSADHLGPELLWNGAFLDGTAKWLDRGTANTPPAGEKFINLGKSKSLPAEARFKGDKLDPAGNPTFIVQIGGQTLLDPWRAEPGAILRTLTLTGPGNAITLPLGSHPDFPEIPTGLTLSKQSPITLTYRCK